MGINSFFRSVNSMLGKDFLLLSEAACVCIYVFMYLSACPSGILAGRCKRASEVSHLSCPIFDQW